MVVGVLFEGVGYPQDRLFVEVFSHDLKANGKVVAAETARDRNPRDTRYIDRDGEYIG